MSCFYLIFVVFQNACSISHFLISLSSKHGFGCNEMPFFSFAAHPGIQPGHPGYLWCAQSARHAWHPRGPGWHCGCSFGEKGEVRTIKHHLICFNTQSCCFEIWVWSYFRCLRLMWVLWCFNWCVLLLLLLHFRGDAAMQAAALASSLGFALVGGAVTGGWGRKKWAGYKTSITGNMFSH